MKLINMFLLLLISYHSFSQKTIIIIGNIHSGNSQITSDTLTKVILSTNPDAILYEADTILNFNDSNLPKDIIEFSSFKSISKTKPFIKFLPYDWYGKRDFMKSNDYWVKLDSISITINYVFSTGKDEILSRTILEAYSDLKTIENLYSEADLRTINSKEYTKIIEIIHKWEYQNLIRMTKQNENFMKIASYFELGNEYWELRNKKMAENVLQILATTNFNRITIITGNYHKYFLIKELERQKEKGHFVIKEFWEN